MTRNYRPLLLTILFIVTTSTVALAVPARLAQQGRLLDIGGGPLSGAHALIFSIYDAATGGSEIWHEERSVDFEDGYYSIVLGEQIPVDDLLFADGPVWLELTVDGAVLSPRQEIVSVPWALRATSAEHVDGGAVDATEISVGGISVIDSTGAWVGPTPAASWNDLTEVPADLADGDQDTVTTTLPWSAITAVPADLADGDQDTNTQLTDLQVDDFVTNAPLDLDAGTTLGSQAISTGSHTVDSDTLNALQCASGEMVLLDPSTGNWSCIDHVGASDAHHSSASSGLALTPSSVTIQGSSTALTTGELDLGPNSDDSLTAGMVQTLTGGGDAETLHTHTGHGGGGCYTAWGTSQCGTGFQAMYTGTAITAGVFELQYIYPVAGPTLCSATAPAHIGNQRNRVVFSNGAARLNAALTCAVCCQ